MKAIEAVHHCPGAPILFTGSPKAAAVVRKGLWEYGIIALFLTGNETMNDVKAINYRESVWYWPEPTAESYRQALDIMEIIPTCLVTRPPKGTSLEAEEITGGNLWFFLENQAMSYSREQVERLIKDYEQQERVTA